MIRFTLVEEFRTINREVWTELTADHPCLRYEFFQALHGSGCASVKTGWEPTFILAWRGEQLVGAMPLYRKHHSYGEYVFDWAWADAYHRHGLEYYPKLLAAIPFTPVTGPRLIGNDPAVLSGLLEQALALVKRWRLSSLHILLPSSTQIPLMEQHGMMLRKGIQFHWHNNDYAEFEDFLKTLSHDKRKKIQQERRKVNAAGIRFRHLTGKQTTPADWALFYRCYINTYREHHSQPYLTQDFFLRLNDAMSENLLLILAERDNRPIATALNIYNQHTLYGRYWGALEYHPGLHFETCYYQTMSFCIANHIQLFEGGAQGEHKLARGFMPVTTWSAHWLAHPAFARAIEDFLDEEGAAIDEYSEVLHQHSPFKRNT